VSHVPSQITGFPGLSGTFDILDPLFFMSPPPEAILFILFPALAPLCPSTGITRHPVYFADVNLPPWPVKKIVKIGQKNKTPSLQGAGPVTTS